ncbi:hypothetical protein CRG98_029318 [Punica granatum]|uniref:Uncharacterized protein n=1 Tax=Punica granatum TaxID=22663 RepID=A0A2I0J1Z6_PUNGR|nr:hypothetical protein CRG98_029318 [Punica granatum]
MFLGGNWKEDEEAEPRPFHTAEAPNQSFPASALTSPPVHGYSGHRRPFLSSFHRRRNAVADVFVSICSIQRPGDLLLRSRAPRRWPC